MKLLKKIPGFLPVLDHIRFYQIVTKAGLIVWAFVLRRIFRLLLKSTGRVALTSGDFIFLFTSWQGPVILALGLFSLFVYVALDLNTKIIMSGKLLKGQKAPVWLDLKEGLLSMTKFLNPRGIWIIIYISLIAPLVGIGLSISLTKNLYIPTFITSVINHSPLYAPLFYAGMAFFTLFGISNIFIMHGVLLDGRSVKEAARQSKQLMKAHWKDYFLQTLRYIARLFLITALILLTVSIIPMGIVRIISEEGLIGTETSRFFMVLIFIITVFCFLRVSLLVTPLYILEITRRYYMYTSGEKVSYPAEKYERGRWRRILVRAATAAGIVLFAYLVTTVFDVAFPREIRPGVVAHRAGGHEAPENTAAGLEVSSKAGAFGAEIDIQRTADGYYIVNHDTTFKRVAGVNKEPSQMTLEEIKELRIDGEPVATFEEMLEGCRGRLILFTELKGKTADIRMAEDAVRIIKEYGMEDEAVIISVKYNLIDYIETHYPEMLTGYLAFASFGDTAALNCDYLALEEELATPENIQSIHENGRKVMIWTTNSKDSQKRFLRSSADAIITDEITQAQEIIRELENRSDFDRLMDALYDWMD
ncbi:MAG: glycerophosphoryl diester phosphodiesterase membrane domain-containing protein [Lachnospiraceae bacterium]|nr:glycerophosphoryl diester phosphodiesterase membrane domain-containing protein [Lachnospiraceae bacterium]